MNELSPCRRLLLAFLGIAVAALLLRGPISDAIVSGGDGQLYAGRPGAALVLYRRALWFDARNAVAADRFAFLAMSQRSPALWREGRDHLGVMLRADPGNGAVRMDRALLERKLGDFRAALHDFARVGRAARDPRALAFAGFCAQRLGRTRRAVVLWRETLALAPGFLPALDGLHRVHARTR